MAPARSTLQGSADAAAVDGQLPGKTFQGLHISVPYARWRGYGTEHGYHKGRITTFSVDEDDSPEGYFTVVFPEVEKAEPITIYWEQLLGEKKHGSVKKACVLHAAADSSAEVLKVLVTKTKAQLDAWRRRVATGSDSEDSEVEDEDGEGEGEDGDEKGTLYYLIDFKRVESKNVLDPKQAATKRGFKGACGLAPIDHVPDTNYQHYSLQIDCRLPFTISC
jgi:hypothetical protein